LEKRFSIGKNKTKKKGGEGTLAEKLANAIGRQQVEGVLVRWGGQRKRLTSEKRMQIAAAAGRGRDPRSHRDLPQGR